MRKELVLTGQNRIEKLESVVSIVGSLAARCTLHMSVLFIVNVTVLRLPHWICTI